MQSTELIKIRNPKKQMKIIMASAWYMLAEILHLSDGASGSEQFGRSPKNQCFIECIYRTSSSDAWWPYCIPAIRMLISDLTLYFPSRFCAQINRFDIGALSVYILLSLISSLASNWSGVRVAA